MSSCYDIDSLYGRKSRRYDEFFSSRLIHCRKQDQLKNIEFNTNDIYWNMFDLIALRKIRITKSSKDANNKYRCMTRLEVV